MGLPLVKRERRFVLAIPGTDQYPVVYLYAHERRGGVGRISRRRNPTSGIAEAPLEVGLRLRLILQPTVKQDDQSPIPCSREAVHEWRLEIPSTERLWTVILHMADLPGIASNIALSGRFAC